jgi:hypothetical protein
MKTKRSKKMLKEESRNLIIGLCLGVLFGLLLHKGGVTNYDVILGQLLLTDFTMIKIILTAIVTGMVGIYGMKHLGWIELKPKAGSWGMNLIGGLIFGIGFALMGYCPGTIAGAVGSGALDALTGGLVGVWVGAGLFAALYPTVRNGILKAGDFGDVTLPKLLKISDWAVVIPAAVLIVAVLFWMESSGL